MENNNILRRSADQRLYRLIQKVKHISETNNLDALKEVLTERISPHDLIQIALKVEDWRIRKFISNMDGIREYTENQPAIGAIMTAQKIDDPDFWAITLSGSNISPADAMWFAGRLEILKVSQVVFSRKDIPWQVGLVYAKQINNFLFWQTVLGIIPPNLAFLYGKEINGPKIGDAVMKRPDVQKWLAAA